MRKTNWFGQSAVLATTAALALSLGCGASPEDAGASLRSRTAKRADAKTPKRAEVKKLDPTATAVKIDRKQVARAIEGVGDLEMVQVPVFKDSVSPGQRKELVARLDKALADMKKESKLPPEIQDGVRVWESLNPQQREEMLTGKFGENLAVPTWAVAAVAAAHLTYEVGKDYNWWSSSRENFELVRMQSKDLDYVGTQLKVRGQPGVLSQREVISAIKSSGDLKGAKIPVFKDSVQPAERKELVARLDKAIVDMKRDSQTLPPKIQDGVRVWEALGPQQRQDMLGGNFGQTAAVPTWAVAAVGAVALAYEFGKDQNWWGSARDKFDHTGMSAKDLDYVQTALKAGVNSPSSLEIVAAIKSSGDLKTAKIPVFKDSVKPGQRKELVARLDQAIGDMRKDTVTLPPRIQDGVRIWESLGPEQREQMLGGKGGVVANSWAVAGVAAVALVYEVGKDYNWWGSAREVFDHKVLTAKELDYVNQAGMTVTAATQIQVVGAGGMVPARR